MDLILKIGRAGVVLALSSTVTHSHPHDTEKTEIKQVLTKASNVIGIYSQQSLCSCFYSDQ